MNTKDKQQEREKQIAAAAKSFSDKVYDYENNRRDYKGSAYDKGFLDAYDQAVEAAFIAGAVFSDINPRPGLVEIDNVRAIHRMWLEDDNDNSDFIEYFYDYCDKEGWL